jgi:flagellar protein FliS
MSRTYGAQSYLQTDVQSATPLTLVVRLYDAAVGSAATAHDAMVRRDIPARRAAINRLMDIIAELQNTLDLERGGKIATDLDGLYTYLLSRLLDAISRQDARPVEEVQRILTTLRGAWQEIARQQAAKVAS